MHVCDGGMTKELTWRVCMRGGGGGGRGGGGGNNI